ncbi:hypothetical protein P4S60_10325 [Pseudoalteromonas sp. Hal040]|uniref:hypothetical protein n=1 Tax=unclassified Pseudoalteromonas TaxID=194690 RepID=UPI00301C85DB
MIELRFISSYQVNNSPLQLGFIKPDYTLKLRFKLNFKRNYSPFELNFYGPDYSLELRFNEPYKINFSPLSIRFDGSTDPVEPEPTLPYLQPNIGVYYGLLWLVPGVEENQTDFQWQSDSYKAEFEAAFNNSEIVNSKFHFKWSVATKVEIESEIFWGNRGYESRLTHLNYKLINDVEYIQSSFPWLITLPIENVEKAQNWSVTELIPHNYFLEWNVQPSTIGRELVIHYGETDAEYICYWRNHPFKGYVLGEFIEPAETHTGHLIMRFTNPDKICYWGLPGGLVRGDDDVPTIDRKIPIEPQIRNTYIMQPTINCVRVSDEQKVLISSFDYSLSRGQYCATANLKFCSRIDYERAIGQELKVSINGYDFYVICEQPSKNLRFANQSFSASGRSRFALLSQPYSRATNYTNPTPKTLAGIMSDILVNTGWSLDNKMIDYPIPQYAFSYTDLTPGAALLAVAKSVGAILDFDDANKTVSVVPMWPVAPWDTTNAICDVILNDSVILEHSSSQTINQEHNAVFVRGEQQGVSCKVKRAGTLADQFAKDVVDSLITDNQAARQRGTCELANSGSKENTTVRTKLLEDLPPIRPGMLVGISYSDSVFKATCDTMSISASVSNTGAVTVNQRIKVISNV